ncbi:hypothetical protein CR513_01150, partial [Mucuna pruriens]
MLTHHAGSFWVLGTFSNFDPSILTRGEAPLHLKRSYSKSALVSSRNQNPLVFKFLYSIRVCILHFRFLHDSLLSTLRKLNTRVLERFDLGCTLCYKNHRSAQTHEGISSGMFHNETAWDIEGLHQNESVSVFPRWSHQGLAILTTDFVQHLGGHEANVFGKYSFWLPELQPSERRFVVLGNIPEKPCMNTRKDSTNCAPHVHTIKFAKLLIQYFNEGLLMMDRNMIDAVSSGALMDKTLAIVRHLISNMASNTQQFGTRGVVTSRVVNEVGMIDNLRHLAVGQHQPSALIRVCGICTSVEHLTNMCPTLQEIESDNAEIFGSIGGYQYGRQPYPSQQYDVANSEIPNTTVPTIATTIAFTIRQFTFNGRVDEAIELPDVTDYFDSMTDVSNSVNMLNMWDLSDSMDNIADPANLVHIFEFSDLTNLECRCDGDPKCSRYVRIHIADTTRPVVA